jgi:hypothetical protein
LDAAALILAVTPVPILLYYISMYSDGHSISDLFGCFSAVWAILATFFVLGGFPGSLFFPVMLGTSALGGFLEYGRSRKKWDLAQGIFLGLALILVVVLLEAI